MAPPCVASARKIELRASAADAFFLPNVFLEVSSSREDLHGRHPHARAHVGTRDSLVTRAFLDSFILMCLRLHIAGPFMLGCSLSEYSRLTPVTPGY